MFWDLWLLLEFSDFTPGLFGPLRMISLSDLFSRLSIKSISPLIKFISTLELKRYLK